MHIVMANCVRVVGQEGEMYASKTASSVCGLGSKLTSVQDVESG